MTHQLKDNKIGALFRYPSFHSKHNFNSPPLPLSLSQVHLIDQIINRPYSLINSFPMAAFTRYSEGVHECWCRKSFDSTKVQCFITIFFYFLPYCSHFSLFIFISNNNCFFTSEILLVFVSGWWRQKITAANTHIWVSYFKHFRLYFFGMTNDCTTIHPTP